MNFPLNAAEHEADGWDVIVVGAGLGGSFATMRLAEHGLKVLVLEPGGLNASPTMSAGRVVRLARKVRGISTADPNSWPETVARYDHYRTGRRREIWPILGQGPGGSSTLYGAALGRWRREDLDGRGGARLNGTPPLPDDWPIAFDELRGYYRAAETVMRVVGERDPLDGDDDSDPSRPPPLTKRDATIMADLERAGMHPYRLKVGIDYVPGCEECLGRRCPRQCKADGYSRALLRGLATGRVELELGTTVSEVAPMGAGWQVVTSRADNGTVVEYRGSVVIVAAGALNTPLILDRSEGLWRDHARPELIGRGLMFHVSDIFLVTLRRKPRQENAIGPSKTIGFRDFYGGEQGIGEVQSFGARVSAGLIMGGVNSMLYDFGVDQISSAVGLARPLAWLASRMAKAGAVFATVQPDPPFAQNRVWEEDDPAGTPSTPGQRPRIAFTYEVSPELRAHSRRTRQRLVAAFAPNRLRFLLRAGTPNLGHPMGTCRTGSDPKHSVVDPHGQVWGHPGLFVGDASVFPSSAGVGPSLTVAALGLRLGDHVAAMLGSRDGTNTAPRSEQAGHPGWRPEHSALPNQAQA